MKFVGSKARIAKDIVPIIQGYLQRGNYRAYVEPFVGGANIIQHIRHPIRLGYDSSKPLIDLLQYVLCGGKLPLTISKRMYDDVKAHPDDYDSWLVGAVGYLASYNGKYFGGYAGARLLKDRVTVRDYYDEAKRNLEKQVKDLRVAWCAWTIEDLTTPLKTGCTTHLYTPTRRITGLRATVASLIVRRCGRRLESGGKTTRCL